MACLNLLVHAGLRKENIIVTDRTGVVYKGRTEGMDPVKAEFAVETNARTLDDAIANADVFLGLSGPGVLDQAKVKKMADAPLILALANPTPEIMPEEALKAKPDAIVCTGRSDFSNQVNNVLCFPFIFRGALDVGATTINEEMKLACVDAIAALARKEATAEVTAVYSDENLTFGADYLIPKPFDPRLIVDLPLAVAKAAMESGVATRPIKDWVAYEQKLQEFYVQSQLIMRPIFNRAKENPKSIVYCEGEEPHVLQAVQMVIDVMERRGVTESKARAVVRTNTTVIGAIMVYKNEVDSMICGTVGVYNDHTRDIIDIIGLKPGVETPAAMNGLLLQRGTYFFCDTQINPNPSVAQLSEMTLLAAEEVSRFGMTPKVGLLSHSNFGSHNDEGASKMRAAYADICRRNPKLEIEGEMTADVALNEKTRLSIMPNSKLKGEANLFIMPTVESANISFNIMKSLGGGISIGPLLLGVARPAHIVTPSISARGIVNVSAITTVSAQVFEKENKSAKKAKKAKAA